MSAPLAVGGIAALLDRFDVFLVDQFGVLLDGRAAYAGAAETLARLKAAGKTVVLLSNSGRRAGPNEARLARLGFSRRSYDFLVSSGEVAWQLLAEGRFGPTPLQGSKCLLLARDRDLSAVEGLGLERTEDGGDADFVLLAGSEGDRLSLDDYSALLAPAAARGVPLLCTNPDRIMLTPLGPRFGAGRIAELYQALGGAVTWVGKPHPAIYRFALARLGGPPGRIVAVGDSIEHDVAGARAAGLSAALVRTGVHAECGAAALAALYRAHGATPDFLLPRFAWDSAAAPDGG